MYIHEVKLVEDKENRIYYVLSHVEYLNISGVTLIKSMNSIEELKKHLKNKNIYKVGDSDESFNLEDIHYNEIGIRVNLSSTKIKSLHVLLSNIYTLEGNNVKGEIINIKKIDL